MTAGRPTALSSKAVAPELSPAFTMLWTLPPGAAFVRVPDGCGDLVWCDGQISVYGPRTKANTIAGSATGLLGLRFLPGAAAKWLGVSAGQIVNVRAPLEEFGKYRAQRLIQAVRDAPDVCTAGARLERALADTIGPETVLDRACLDTVLELLESQHGAGGFLRALQRAYRCSERHARRETIKTFGYPPKTVERIWRVQRFLHVARAPGRINLARMASTVGFSDQAHMTREVRSITGLTPGQLLKCPFSSKQ
jgi:AraC-like DNA-binding protein